MSMVGRILLGAVAAGATLAACGGGEGGALMQGRQSGQGIAVGEPNGGVPVVSEYIKLAQDASCASARNNLYLIDSKYVLWDRAGDCADASYSQTLMGATPHAVLCTAGDSIAGPRTSCSDASLRPLFDTVLKNLDKADLGLGAGHKVEQVPFLPKSGTPVAFTSVAQEAFSNITSPREVVIKDAAAWSALWAEHSKTRTAAPQVDFSRTMLVAVFNGERANGCRMFSVVYAGAHEGKLRIEYEDRDVSPVALCLQAVAQPMHVVALPRMEVPVAFVKHVTPFVNVESIDATTRSGVTTARKLVVRDAAAWATLWAEHAGRDVPSPSIDFTRKMVIGVFLGAQPDGCRGTTIQSVASNEGRREVRHIDAVPGPGMLCTMAITYPAHLVAVDRSEAPVVFFNETRAVQ